MSSSPRQGAYQAKLKALVREHFSVDDGAVGSFPGGATLRAGDGRGFVLVEEDAERSLGGALAWGRQNEVRELHVLGPADAAGVLARRAGEFAEPAQVHLSIGAHVEPAAPTSLPVEPPLPPEAEPYRALFAEVGAEAVVEHGLLLAEVLGLEVGRVVDGALEVGVGKHDREAQKLMHPDRRPPEALRAAVEAVKAVRHVGASPHPMNQLAASRWLRAVVCRRPDLIGVSALTPVASPTPRSDDLRVPAPAFATGDGLVVACSVGIDLDLVPEAADARLAHASPDTRLVIVVPEADAHPLTIALASDLRVPADVVTVPPDWRLHG